MILHSILFQAYSLGDFAGFLGNGLMQAFGGSPFIVGIFVLFGIGLFAWKYNVHMTTAFFLAFIALTFLKTYMNDSMNGQLGLFGTLYNMMLLGMAIVAVLFISELRK